ncbi:MAG: ABC transporter ATP-binding protein [Hyphomicrobiaceae bacterium]|nr:ABC transporter ATP-binding protein [Hyphomicrobiaceae bacterium]
MNLVEIDDIEAGYGPARVLFGVSLTIADGECVTLIGRNGMGKTTLIRALCGLLPVATGTIRIGGVDMTAAPPHRRAVAGLGLVPEGRLIFPRLSVEENLIATAARRKGRDRFGLKDIYELFPRLAERRANMGTELSGGEQQMLAIGRALMTNPALLILDEATEGLAPVVRADIWACLARLRQAGLAILIVDKHIDALTRLADRHVVMEKGAVVFEGSSAALTAEDGPLHRHVAI